MSFQKQVTVMDAGICPQPRVGVINLSMKELYYTFTDNQ